MSTDRKTSLPLKSAEVFPSFIPCMMKFLCLFFLLIGTTVFSASTAYSAKGSMEEDMDEPAWLLSLIHIYIELINVPLLMMAGEKADTLYMSEEAFEKATGTRDKELFKIPGATHIQTYFVPEYVDQMCIRDRPTPVPKTTKAL